MLYRLQHFMRSVRDQQSPGWYLQLDIKNFFNRINREILYDLLKKHLVKMERKGHISAAEQEWLQWLSHRMLARHPARNVAYVGQNQQHRVPEYKQLAHAPANCGLPIGNLTSQFFANVYLNELDQFIKRTLQCRHYVRYVDDFVLLHTDRDQLLAWQQQIECFLAERLQLELKAGSRLAPLGNGADFLGYIVRPDYRLVRQRVIAHLNEKLDAYGQQLSGLHVDLRSVDLEGVRSLLSSYLGHFHHADSYRLQASLWQQHPWLAHIFIVRMAPSLQLLPRWQPPLVTGLSSQFSWFAQQWPHHLIIMQLGWRFVVMVENEVGRPAVQGQSIPDLLVFLLALRHNHTPHLLINEQGYLRRGLKRRIVAEIYG